MTAQIAAIVRLIVEEIDHLAARNSAGGNLSQAERRFLDVFGTIRGAIVIIRSFAIDEAAGAAERILATGTTQSPERGGTGPGSV